MHAAEIQEVLRKNTSTRYLRLDQLERYVVGTQYEGRPLWWDDSVPLFQRAPCIVWPIVQTAISSHVGMVFRRPPVVSSAPDEDETEIDPEFGLDEDTSAKFDAGIAQIMHHAKIGPALKCILREAMGCGTAVAIPAVRNGYLKIDTTAAKWCKPTFADDDSRVVIELEILYPFIQEHKDPVSGCYEKKVMLFRRVIDEKADTTFLPVEAPKHPALMPRWAPDPKKTIDHKLGFCPVLWYPFMGVSGKTGSVDGEAIHANLLDEVTALDFSVSQRHRAVLYNADPITCEFGVEEGYNPSEPAPMGAYMGSGIVRDDKDPNIIHGSVTDDPRNRSWGGRDSGKMGRKRGPGTVWQYNRPRSESSVELLTLPPGAVEAMQINVAELERVLCEALHWMPMDPKSMQSGATLSGRALEWLHKKQVDYCDDVRTDLTEHAFLPLLNLVFRLLCQMRKRGVQIYLPGFEVTTDILDRFETDEQWTCPRLSVKWSPYFEPSEQDQQMVIEATIRLKEAGLLKTATCIERIAPFYGIENPAAYAEDQDKKHDADEASLKAAQETLAKSIEPPTEPAKDVAEQEPPPPSPKPQRRMRPSPFKKRTPRPAFAQAA